ncbi:hypothetical protein N9B20_04575, partial [Mariniblastus sp.]|nr:hypothetical protein [Mariniblastus sp.]
MINGLISSVRQMLTYIKTLEMGLAGAVIIELYKPLAKKNDREVSRVLSASQHFFNQVGLFFSIGAVILAVTYPFIVDCKGLPWYYVTILVVLMGLSGAINFFLVSSWRVLLNADQRSYVVSLIGAVIGVLSLGITVFVISMGYDIIAIPLITAFGALMTAYLVAVYARHTYGSRFRFDLLAEKAAIPQRSAVFLNQISFVVEFGAPLVIATFTLGLTSVSVLSVYNMVLKSLQSFTKTLPVALKSSFGELYALEDQVRLKNAYFEYDLLYIVLIGWIYTTASILLLPFIRVYTQGITDANYDQPLVAGLLISIGLIRQVKQPCSTIVRAAGKFQEIKSNSVQSAILGVGMGCIGALVAGLNGLLVGFAISAVYRSAFIIFFCHRHILILPLIQFGKRVVWNSLLFIIAWMPFNFWIQIKAESLWVWFVWACGVFTWVGVVFIVGNLVSDVPTSKRIFV